MLSGESRQTAINFCWFSKLYIINQNILDVWIFWESGGIYEVHFCQLERRVEFVIKRTFDIFTWCKQILTSLLNTHFIPSRDSSEVQIHRYSKQEFNCHSATRRLAVTIQIKRGE
eukprot:TRINITY_DN5055_c1_g1_i2.p5 TRINITY_DN5055_c1_g1~~TRINITY_DN5055_c1_g1_i2.p5  ORF type:complete len:115 (-),score=4.43 TRINITY_DN5055_c1_g1_i2:224-568(-)